MLESYGGIVTRMNLRYVEGCGAAALIALLGRQKRVAEVTVEREKVIPALCQAIIQNGCRRVEAVHLRIWYPVVTQEESDLLAEALERDGALPA